MQENKKRDRRFNPSLLEEEDVQKQKYFIRIAAKSIHSKSI